MGQSRSPELSDILARLSTQAKKVEDAFADLAEKTDTAAARRDERVQAGWRSMQADIDNQIKEMRAARAAREHERDVQRAEQNAQAAQARADWAAAYAVAASEMARLAALDAEAARSEANALKLR
ncbi:MAG: hypothetical protein IT338_15550 [Thermomicrobiales bacterium]|nr:hypothetical protein [Thermomicrobiales bacterium]